MPYPSVVTTFTNPQPTDKLNSPSHSSIESAQNTGLTEIQTFLGTLSSAVGTIVYDVRASASNGGGHVQTANKGGTGQTAFTKGDLLVATSSSVLSKFSVGSNDQVIVADSTADSGIKWTNNSNAGTKIYITTNSVVGTFSGSTSLLSATIPASTLSTNNGILFRLTMSQFQNNTGGGGMGFALKYGSNTIATTGIGVSNVAMPFVGYLEGYVLADGATNKQRGMIRAVCHNPVDSSFTQLEMQTQGLGTSSIESTASANLVITASIAGASGSDGLTMAHGYVEKISS